MHNTANDAAFKYAGVWMVGDDHVRDIAQKHGRGNEIKYALIRREDFDVDFDAWKARTMHNVYQY